MSKKLLFSTSYSMPILSVITLTVLAFATVATADPLRIPSDEAKRSIISKVAPVTPPIAKQAHITGTVVCDLVVAEDGSVEKVDVVSGNPILAGAASKAGKSWSFKPFKGADNNPSKAVVRLSFDF